MFIMFQMHVLIEYLPLLPPNTDDMTIHSLTKLNINVRFVCVYYLLHDIDTFYYLCL